jgi:hypothetical protein
MGDPVNLNHARKAAAKRAAEAQAAANRVKFGRTKAEKLADRAAEARRLALLEGVRRDDKGSE